MNTSRIRFTVIASVACALSFCLPAIARAQDDRKPIPESPRTESPRSDPPAEAPRSEPPRSESPSSPPPSSPPSSGGSSSNNESRNNDGGSRSGSDSGRGKRDDTNTEGRGRSSDDSSSRRTNTNPPAGNNANPRVRGTMEGDGSDNRRGRVIVNEDGDPIPSRISGGGTPGVNPPGNRTGGNPGSGNRTGGNPGGRENPGGTHPGGGRPRGGHPGGDRDRDRCPDRDQHGDRHGGHHRHTDVCYRVPTYDDTIIYTQTNYPDYDDSQSAYDIGYQDGVFTGANDGRRGQTYDPERSHFYREARRGYRAAKGSRDDYQQAYRDGFLSGYREGFEHWQDHFFGGVFRP